MKKISIFLTQASVPLLFPTIVFGGITQNNSDATLTDFTVRIINYILGFSSALAILFIIIGGVQYITSSGNEDKIKVAKKTLTYAIIGLLMVMFALVIVKLIKSATYKIL